MAFGRISGQSWPFQSNRDLRRITPVKPLLHEVCKHVFCVGVSEYQGLNPSEDVFGLDHHPDRFLADSLSDMSYFISSFSLPQAHSRVINTMAETGHIFLIFSALTLFNRVI